VRAYVTLAAFAGLRVHEIAKVRGEDVRDELHVVGKGGVTATVPLHGLVVDLRDRMPSRDWWFPAPSGHGHVHRCSVSTAISAAMRRAEVDAVPHALRHFFCSEVLRSSGGDLRTAQRAARHASPATTAIYTQVADETLTKAVVGIPSGQEAILESLDWQHVTPCESTSPENIKAHPRPTPPAAYAVRRLPARRCCGASIPEGRVTLTCQGCVDRLLAKEWDCDACGTEVAYTDWYNIAPLA
jgi:hypothetical protein